MSYVKLNIDNALKFVYQAQLEEVPERIKKYLNKSGTEKEI